MSSPRTGMPRARRCFCQHIPTVGQEWKRGRGGLATRRIRHQLHAVQVSAVSAQGSGVQCALGCAGGGLAEAHRRGGTGPPRGRTVGGPPRRLRDGRGSNLLSRGSSRMDVSMRRRAWPGSLPFEAIGAAAGTASPASTAPQTAAGQGSPSTGKSTSWPKSETHTVQDATARRATGIDREERPRRLARFAHRDKCAALADDRREDDGASTPL